MRLMFEGALVFNRDICGWAVNSVMDMTGMFLGARAFNQDIGGWAVESVTSMVYMLETAFSGTVCASTLCGVTQGSCPP